MLMRCSFMYSMNPIPDPPPAEQAATTIPDPPPAEQAATTIHDPPPAGQAATTIPDPPPAEQAATTAAAADELLPIRTLEIADKGKGFVDLLGQLSPCPTISDADFRSRFEEITALGDDHIICVVEDPISGRIVATGSVFVEKKFLRGCGKVGHIEDVVVDGASRGFRLGQRVVRYLAEHARAAGCYKVILDCRPELRGFYEKCGFVEKNVQMTMYFHD